MKASKTVSNLLKRSGFGLLISSLLVSLLAAVSLPTANAASGGLKIYIKNEAGASPGILRNAFTTGTCHTATAAINYDWGSGSPGGTCGIDSFTVYATGYILAPVTGTVNFCAIADDGFHLTINTSVVINNWIDQGPNSNCNATGTFPMTSGLSYPITVWMHENGGGAVMRMLWSYSGQSSYIPVPASNLGTFRANPPTIGTATKTGQTTANVSFSAPTLNGGSTITSYTATSSPGGITGSLSQSGSGTISVSGLSPGTAYTFSVVANNSDGASLASSQSNSITTDAGTGYVPTFGTTSATTDGFTVTITNYDATYTWVTPTVSSGSVAVTSTSGSNRVLTVTGLSPGSSATITQQTTRTGYNSGSATVIGSSIESCAVSADTDSNPGYAIWKFTTAGKCNWAVPAGVREVSVLVVAGGAGGGYSYDNSGAGGGGGGQVKISPLTVSGVVEVNVGAGGARGISTSQRGGSGSNSSISSVIALGGTGGCGSRSACSVASQATGQVSSSGGSAANGGAGGVGGAAGRGGGGSNISAATPTTTTPGLGTSSDFSGSSTTYGIGGQGGTARGASTNIVGVSGTSNTGNGGGGASAANSSGDVNGGIGGSGIVIVRQALTSITSVSSSTADGSYTVGQAVSIQVNFSGAVTVTGTPTLLLETGDPDRSATFVNVSGTSTLNFTYTVQTGDTSADLNYVGTSSLALSSGTIKDSTGNDATLTLPAISNASSLGGSKAIVIDTTAPTFSSAAVTTDGTQIILTYNSALSATTASTSAFSVTVASASASVSTVGISGSTVVLTMASRITTGQVVSFTYTDPTSGNDANAIQDLAGNDAATLGSTSVTNNSTITRPVFAAPATIPTATAGTAYTLTLTAATGGSGSGYTYSVATGTLPAGLTLTGRIISGTPTATGTFSGISITVTDGNLVTTTTATFSITVNSGTQLELSIVTRFGTGGSALTLFATGGSGGGVVTYALNPLVTQPSCSLSGANNSSLSANFGVGISGSCSVIATRAGLLGFTDKASIATTIFFTAYIEVIKQTTTCPAGTVPSAPSGIGVGSCIQVLAPVSPTAGDSGAAPKITLLSATSGLVGATITITGTGFSTVTRVQFGTKSTTTFTATSTTITVAVPTGATRGRVMVVSPTGTAMAAQIFTVMVVDTQAPGFTGGSVNTSTKNEITLNFDETIDGTGVAAISFAVSVTAAGVTESNSVTGISVSGTTITLTLANLIRAGQTVEFTYTSPNSSASIKDAADNRTATITSTRLTNNVS